MFLLLKNEKLFIKKADRFSTRLMGLMFKSAIQENFGLLLIPCSSIHTFFMRFPIDAVYLDASNLVLGKETIYPGKIGKRVKGTRAVLELSAGKAESIEPGMTLAFSDEA